MGTDCSSLHEYKIQGMLCEASLWQVQNKQEKKNKQEEKEEFSTPQNVDLQNMKRKDVVDANS